MIGTALAETLVQVVAVSHLVKHHQRVSLLLIAAPESGKTTIVKASASEHVCPIAVMSGLSILREVKEHRKTEFLLFNDLSTLRAMSHHASSMAIGLLNQLVLGEKGHVAFAGKESVFIDRAIGVIGCIPFRIFTDHRARWREMGFVSRMIPFAYRYDAELVAEIKDSIDNGARSATVAKKMPRARSKQTDVAMSRTFTRIVRRMADARATSLDQLGIRLLQNYHCLIRAHALLNGRRSVTHNDLQFLRAVDRYVSIEKCEPLIDRRDDA